MRKNIKLKRKDFLKMEKKKETESTPIEKLNLSTRPYNCLKRVSINTVEELVQYTEEDLQHVRNLSMTSLAEIKDKLNSISCHLKKD